MSVSLITAFLTQLLSLIPASYITTMINTGLNAIEDDIAKAGNADESGILLPLIAVLRSTISIPDTHTLAASPAGTASGQATMIVSIISEIFSMIPVSAIKTMISTGLDDIEKLVVNNATESGIVMPIIALVRSALTIPDAAPPVATPAAATAAKS